MTPKISRSYPSKPISVFLFRKRVFAYVIKLKGFEMRLSWVI